MHAVTEPLLSVPGQAPSSSEVHRQKASSTAGERISGSNEEGDHVAVLDQIRAAVLGACDGIVTTGALVTGIAAAQASQHQLLLSAAASMVSGAAIL